jgi:hypothetical protein
LIIAKSFDDSSHERSINVYFHALPEEQLEILRSWLSSHEDVSVVMLYWSPTFKLVELENISSLDEGLQTHGIPRRICLGFESPQTGAKTAYDFMLDNADWTCWDIGEFDAEGLRESQFSASTNNALNRKAWTSLATKIKKVTTAGMWVINPETGANRFYKQCRFSNGAAELAKSGKRLLPVGGWNYYLIERAL